MSPRRALRLGLRREALVVVPVTLFVASAVSLFVLGLYRHAVLELVAERQEEARVAAERLASSLARGGLPSSSEFEALAPQARRLALINRKGQTVLARGSVPEGDPLAPFRGIDRTSAQALGPNDRLPRSVAALAPVGGDLRGHFVRVDLRADRLGRERARLRLLTIAVIGINVAVLLTVIFYARSLLAPFEAMLESAKRARPEDAREHDEVEFLVGTFEEALRALQRPAAEGVEADIQALERTLGPSLESGLLVVDRHRRLLSINPVGRRLLGRRVRTPGVAIEHAVSDHPALLAVVQEVMETDEAIHRREVRLEVDGEARTLGLTAHALRRDDGAARGFLVMFADLTQAHRRAEEQQVATSLAQVGELAAGVAHELRNSLATLKGYLRLVEKAPDEESIEDYLGELNRESDHLQRVLEDFLSFARPGTTRLETLDLEALARRAAADPALEGVAIEVEAEPDLDTDIQGDVQLLERAVRNLLHNAAEAERRAGGDGPVVVSLRGGANGLSLVIDDRGPGVPEEVNRRLFRPFSTGRADGVGLGLALARRIVDLHGGSLALESRSLGGTRAVLSFPPAADRGSGGAPLLPPDRS